MSAFFSVIKWASSVNDSRLLFHNRPWISDRGAARVMCAGWNAAGGRRAKQSPILATLSQSRRSQVADACKAAQKTRQRLEHDLTNHNRLKCVSIRAKKQQASLDLSGCLWHDRVHKSNLKRRDFTTSSARKCKCDNSPSSFDIGTWIGNRICLRDWLEWGHFHVSFLFIPVSFGWWIIIVNIISYATTLPFRAFCGAKFFRHRSGAESSCVEQNKHRRCWANNWLR